MTYFKWSSHLELGDPQIDAQHKQLLLLGEAVVEALLDSANHDSGLARLQAMIDCAQKHFEFEEGLMRSVAYPESERHAKYHASLLAELRIFHRRMQLGRRTSSEALIGFIWDWLTLHIDSPDRELVTWLGRGDPDRAGETN